jgi:hypothetical protein
MADSQPIETESISKILKSSFEEVTKALEALNGHRIAKKRVDVA